MLEKLVIRILGAGLGDMPPFVIETYALLKPLRWFDLSLNRMRNLV